MNDREWLLHRLKEFNSPELVKQRGYISCFKTINIEGDYIFNEFLSLTGCKRGYVGGLATGAIYLASAIVNSAIDYNESSCYYVPFYVRKEEKAGRLVEFGSYLGPKPEDDRPVIIVDDVLNTGYSIAKASKVVEKEWGYKPTLAVVLVDNEVGGKEFLKEHHGIECKSIFTRKEILG